MAWLAVDVYGEYIFERHPYRDTMDFLLHNVSEHFVKLPRGTIKKILGRPLTWQDDPVELKEEQHENRVNY